jgi:hypothetical protein
MCGQKPIVSSLQQRIEVVTLTVRLVLEKAGKVSEMGQTSAGRKCDVRHRPATPARSAKGPTG